MTVRITLALASAALVLSGCIGSPTAPRCTPVQFSTASVSGDTVTTTTGLRYIDAELGSGIEADWCRAVAVHYSVFLTDGTRIDTSREPTANPMIFVPGFGDLIAGFEQGVIEMQIGGHRRLIVPPELAYGSTGRGQIPPNATLIIDLELLDAQGP